MSIKQVIVVRRDLKMRRGKEIAQGAHASITFLTQRLLEAYKANKPPNFLEVEREWFEGSFAKVTLQASSERELLEVYELAKKSGLTVYLITDDGKTEFGGEPTYTALAIGPDYSERIDKITGVGGQYPLQLY